MRAVPTVLVMFLTINPCSVMMLCQSAEAQNTDPFGPGQTQAQKNPAQKAAAQKAALADPFTGDPFAAPVTNVASKNKQTKAVQGPQTVPGKATDAENNLQAVLDQKVSATFIDTPLRNAVSFFSQQLAIPIVINQRALDELGLDADEPVTLELNNVTLRSFLRLMLRDLDLTYMIKDEVMQITTLQDAEDHLTIKMRVLPKQFAVKADSLVDAVTSTVVPATWQSAGGPSAIIAFDHVLIVSTTSDNHARVKAFLDKLIEFHGQPSE